MIIFQEKTLSQSDEELLKRLVVSISSKYQYPDTLEIKDLWQAAEMSLLKVKEKYDPNKGKLSSYAYIAIERAIRRTIKKAKGKIQTISLDKNLGEGNFTLHDVMEDKRSSHNQLIENLQNSELKTALQKLLSELAPRDAEIVSKRFGLKDGCPKTLEEIAKEYKITRERIRQIEAKALRKLRAPGRIKKLRTFL